MWYKLLTMKIKDLHIRVTQEQLNTIELIAQRDRVKKSQVLERAIENYFKLKRTGQYEKNKN